MKQDIIDEIIWNAGSIDNLIRLKQDWETHEEYLERIYTEAHSLFMDAVMELDLYHLNNEGVAPYDDIRDETIYEIMDILVGSV